MKYMDRNELPVEVRENKLPEDNTKHYKMFYDYRVRTSGGFASALFLGGVMMTCVLWGMLIILMIR